ncbi:caspase family protein [Actinoplanes bogorensis]|uniref:Caspase family protein n=1 Tax=Paractinoplanes bogorensis TaxID=1610840 RepID=A0ABS5YYZ2_9ACTN|nr:caspase family protein [Actinoplanes bogorensis]MBU2667909.1 caspase family protein [Actinoplanes bogorensis]
MTRRALVVGINDYSRQRQRSAALGLSFPVLTGCVTDAKDMYALLTTAFGFEEVHLLLDQQAGRDRILGTLRAMIDASAPGDVVCFYYSGHGGILPATKDATNTRYYEAIIPATGDWIFDRRLEQMAERLRPGEVNFTLIMDSCHSGGLHRADAEAQAVPRSVPMDADVLAVIEHIQTLIPCGACLPPGATAMDGNVSSPVLGDRGFTDLDTDRDKTLVGSAKATLLSACQYWQTALEAGGHGLFTSAILEMVDRSGFDESYSDVLDTLRAGVQAAASKFGHVQEPQLYGQLGRMDEGFLQPWNASR